MPFTPIIGLGYFCLLEWSTMSGGRRCFCWAHCVVRPLPLPHILIPLLPSESAVDHKIGLCDCLRISLEQSQWWGLQRLNDSLQGILSVLLILHPCSMLHSPEPRHHTYDSIPGTRMKSSFYRTAYTMDMTTIEAWSNLPSLFLLANFSYDIIHECFYHILKRGTDT